MEATMYKPKKERSSNEWGNNNFWDWALMIIISLMIFGTCISCSRTVLPPPSVTVKEKIVERVIKDTVTIQLPSERIEVVRKDSSTINGKLATTTAKILSDGSLFHNLVNKPTLPVQIEHKETISTRDSIIRIPYPVPGKDVIVYKHHWYETMFMWIGIITLALVSLSALGRWAWAKA